MGQRKNKFDMLISDEQRRELSQAIIDHWQSERDKEIGVVAAGEILDFFLEALGPVLYNRGVDDARKIFKAKLENLDVDLDVLLQK